MKGPNPFEFGTVMANLVGRKKELELFSNCLTVKGKKIAIIGTKGIGKTALVRKFRQLAEKNRLRASLVYVNKKQNAKEIAEKARSEDSEVAFLEDSDNNNELIEEIEKITNKVIVVTAKTEKNLNKDIFILIKLLPLNEIEIKEFIEERLKDKGIEVASGCLELISEETEGHPLVLSIVLWNLYDKLKENEKVITKGHYLSNINSTLELLGHNFFDELYAELSEGEKKILQTAVKSSSGTPKEIAEIAGKPLNTVTTLLIRLVESGNIVKISRGKYRIFNRLYGKYIKGQ